MNSPAFGRITRIAAISSALLITACQPKNPPPTDDPIHPDDTSKTNPLSINYRPPVQSETEIAEVPVTGINLGWGWDRSEGQLVPSVCVEFVEASEPAQTRYMSMSEVSDSYELMSSMGMSAQASVKTIGYDVSGKAAFAKTANISSYSSNFVMNATVENGVRYTAPTEEGYVRLTPTAATLARRDLAEFEHQCGDSFVSAIYSGAKLTAVITIETHSQKEKQKMSAELSGSGWGTRFKGAMNKKSGSATENKNMTLSIFQTGGRGDGIPKDQDELLAKLDILPAIAFDAPKDFHMATTPYELLANWPAKPIIPSQQEFAQLASYGGAYNTLYDEIQTVLDNSQDYTAPTLLTNQCVGFTNKDNEGAAIPTVPKALTPEQITRLERVQDDVRDSLLRLQNFARFCSAADEKCEFPEDAFRSPVAFRAQLPLPIAPTSVTDKDAYDLATLAQAQLVSPTKLRCDDNKSDPLCMSNQQINDWKQKLGYELVKFDTLEARDKRVAKLKSEVLPPLATNCADKTVERKAWFSVEPGYPALWYHPAISTCALSEEARCSLTPLAPQESDEPNTPAVDVNNGQA